MNPKPSLDTALNDTTLRKRTVTNLRKIGVLTVGELIGFTQDQLVNNNKGFGFVSLKDVKNYLSANDLSLKEEG